MPLLADSQMTTEIAGWVAGFDNLENKLPAWAEEVVATINAGSGAPPPPSLPTFTDEPVVTFPKIEEAVVDLLERNIMTRPQFDRESAEARVRAFTVAGDQTTDTIDRIRNVLAETIQDGASLQEFKSRLDESLQGGFLGPAHLETVYRTNTQAAFTRGRDVLAANPVVSTLFPYKAYDAIRDGRARETHLALERLGLSGTNIYRADDPMWFFFEPPWDYNCRCASTLLTVEQAAKAGVAEAQEWLESGRPPAFPDYRLDDIPFRPDNDFVGPGRLQGVA